MAILDILKPLEIISQIYSIPYIYSNNRRITLIAICYGLINALTRQIFLTYSMFQPEHPIVYFEVITPLYYQFEIRLYLKLVNEYLLNIYSIIFTLIPIVHYQSIMKLRRMITHIEIRLNLMNNSSIKSKEIKIKLLLNSLAIVITFILIILDLFYIYSSKKAYFIFKIYMLLHPITVKLSILQMCGYFYIYTELVKSINKSAKNIHCRIDELIKLYDLIRIDGIKLFNRIYGLQLLICANLCFFTILVGFYDHYISNKSKNNFDHCCGAFWMGFYFITLCVVMITINNFQKNLDKFGSYYHGWELQHVNFDNGQQVR